MSTSQPLLERAAKVTANFRPEIQALRALAVGSVVLYHLWGNRLTGGFLGVDVFFVISGFLITSHLIRDADGANLHLPRFWARRIRRLIPASLLVLFVTGIAVVLIVPSTMWQQFLSEIIASAVYVENWLLVSNSVDYLALDNVASPVQHFWSLSTEEQFYIVWPVAIALTLLARKVLAHRVNARSARKSLGTVLLVITIASFVTALVMVPQNPTGAFFATTTRAWEFGAGSLLAFVPAGVLLHRLPEAVRSILSWLAWIVLIACMFVFTAQTPHPYLPTLVPVLATVAVIWLGSPLTKWSPTVVTRLRPVQWLGDISYSLYLWHWPLIILIPYVTLVPLRTLDKLAIIVVALVLAWLSYRFVEGPTRVMRLTSKRGSAWRWFAFVAAAALVVAALPAASLGSLAAQQAHDAEVAQHLQEQQPECYGAAALDHVAECESVLASAVMTPSPANAPKDILPGTPGCGAALDVSTAQACYHVGGTGDGLKVAVIGDSHASHISPWVYALADEYDWSVTLLSKGRCPYVDATRDVESVLQVSCEGWKDNVEKLIDSEHYDLVITTQVSGTVYLAKDGESSDQVGVSGLVTAWQRILDQGTKILVVKDNPRARTKVLDCLDAVTDGDYSVCDNPVSKAFPFDPQVDAVKQIDSPDVSLLDMDDAYCRDGECPAVIGGVEVYRDASHLTATYGKTLTPIADARIPAAFKQN